MNASGFIVATFSAAMFLAAAPSGGVEPRVIELRDLPLLFADDSGIATKSGVVRTVQPARTRRAPVLEAERPWDDRPILKASDNITLTCASPSR